MEAGKEAPDEMEAGKEIPEGMDSGSLDGVAPAVTRKIHDFFFSASRTESFTPPMVILNFAFGLLALAVSSELGVTEESASRFLDSAFGLLGRTGGTIFIHVGLSPFVGIFAGGTSIELEERWEAPNQKAEEESERR